MRRRKTRINTAVVVPPEGGDMQERAAGRESTCSLTQFLVFL